MFVALVYKTLFLYSSQVSFNIIESIFYNPNTFFKFENYQSVMVLDVSCDDCGDPLEEKGAILFSPPEDQIVEKTHLCRGCYRDIIEDIESDSDD